MAACMDSISASPTPMPRLPPRKSKGCTPIITFKPSMVPRAAVKASGRPVFERAALISSAYFFSPRKRSGSAERWGAAIR
jgi:hypothetical protein